MPDNEMTPRQRNPPRGSAAPCSAPTRSTGPSEQDELASTAGSSIPSAPAPAPRIAKYTEADLQRILKVCLEAKGPQEGPFPDLYFGKSHMECYQFCQQCEDYFDTAGAKDNNRTLFAASFLRGRIGFRWHQHKRRIESHAPLSWVDFKAFLRKNLGDSRAFVDTIWSSVLRDSQYQQEEVQDWAFHLEHLQALLIEFDADGAPKESDLIRIFRQGLKPSIKAQMEQRRKELDDWDKILEKAINAEAKANLQPPSMLREMDQRCQRGNRPVHTTGAKFQASASRDPRDEPPNKAQAYDDPSASSERTQTPAEPMSRYSSRHSLRSGSVETSDKKYRKEKKKQRRQEQARKISTPAASGSATSPAGGARNSGVRKNLSHITCFKCDKKGHYADKCPEPKDYQVHRPPLQRSRPVS